MSAPAPANRDPQKAQNLRAAKADSANVKGAQDCSNTVKPRIEPEYKVTLLERKLSVHQKRESNKLHVKADPTYVLVWAEQTNGDQAPWKGKGTLTVTPANAEVFLDEECKKKLSGKLTAKQLTGGTKKKLWLRGTKTGEFKVKLELEDPQDEKISLESNPVEVDMAVAEIQMEVYAHDPAAVARVQVDPDQEPLSQYHTALKDQDLPDPVLLSDKDKVQKGRLVHEQKDASFGRAKVIVKKLEAAQWPADTDAYEIVLDEKNLSGGLRVYDAEFDGTEQPMPVKLKVSDLKANPKTLWVEGKTCTDTWRGARLDLGLDRPAADPPKKIKRAGDWARFTVVKIDEIELEYKAKSGRASAWDQARNRFYINVKKDPGGREIKVRAKLSKPLPGVVLHFTLVEDKDNRKTANWGADLPTGAPSNKWTWKDIPASLKHEDKDDRKNLLHVSAKTDKKGQRKKKLTLSRFGGDKFYLAAYIEQDPHLAKYIDGHADLGKRKPAMRANAIQVWRRFWYKEVKVGGLTVKGFGNAADTYADVRALMEPTRVVEMSRAKADRLRPRVIYPKHMVSYYWDSANRRYVNNYPGDNGDALIVGDDNESAFFKLAKREKDKPVMIPMLNAHALWVKDGDTGAKNVAWQASTAFPTTVDVGKETLDPPISGGDLYRRGRWEAEDLIPPPAPAPGAPPAPPAPPTWGNRRGGQLAPGDIELDPNRNDPETVRVKLPAGLTVSPNGTRVRIRGLVVRASKSYLGTSYDDGIVNAYTPNDEQDFINTINHELGHSFKQVAKSPPAGIPAHSLQYDKDGSHCNYQNKSCLMYESGPQPGSLNRFCPVCHPYVLVQDMSKV